MPRFLLLFRQQVTLSLFDYKKIDYRVVLLIVPIDFWKSGTWNIAIWIDYSVFVFDELQGVGCHCATVLWLIVISFTNHNHDSFARLLHSRPQPSTSSASSIISGGLGFVGLKEDTLQQQASCFCLYYVNARAFQREKIMSQQHAYEPCVVPLPVMFGTSTLQT